MKPTPWLREEADDRLQGLFAENLDTVHKAVRDLVERCLLDPEIEELLIETLQAAISQGNDETQASVWMTVVLGELESREAVPVLVQALSFHDEMVSMAAVHSLRRIGLPAFEALLEILDGEGLNGDTFTAMAGVLRGVTLHDYPQILEQVESALLRYVIHPPQGRDGYRCMETAALTLARMGVARARQPIERVLKDRYDSVHAYLQEALDILEEHPQGIPCDRNDSWDGEFRWAAGDQLPGGELENLGKPAKPFEGRAQSGDPHH